MYITLKFKYTLIKPVVIRDNGLIDEMKRLELKYKCKLAFWIVI